MSGGPAHCAPAVCSWPSGHQSQHRLPERGHRFAVRPPDDPTPDHLVVHLAIGCIVGQRHLLVAKTSPSTFLCEASWREFPAPAETVGRKSPVCARRWSPSPPNRSSAGASHERPILDKLSRESTYLGVKEDWTAPEPGDEGRTRDCPEPLLMPALWSALVGVRVRRPLPALPARWRTKLRHRLPRLVHFTSTRPGPGVALRPHRTRPAPPPARHGRRHYRAAPGQPRLARDAAECR